MNISTVTSVSSGSITAAVQTSFRRGWQRGFPCYNSREESSMSDRITAHPEIHFGRPCVAGTRITVENVLELVREGIPFAEIVRDYYPELSVDDVRACVQ
jgi:uncharacterized protein (DUF433 family)